MGEKRDRRAYEEMIQFGVQVHYRIGDISQGWNKEKADKEVREIAEDSGFPIDAKEKNKLPEANRIGVILTRGGQIVHQLGEGLTAVFKGSDSERLLQIYSGESIEAEYQAEQIVGWYHLVPDGEDDNESPQSAYGATP